MATIQVQVPIEIKVFVAAKAPELFPFTAQMTLHFAQGFRGIDHRKTAAMFHLLDLFENLNQFVGFVADETGVAEAEVAGSEAGERIAERATPKTKRSQKIGQLIVIIHELARGNTRGRLDVKFVKDLVGAFN